MAYTITGFWKSATFYCKHHPDVPMELKQGAYSAYYGCVNEYDEAEPCHNRLNLLDAERALQKLMDVLTKSVQQGDMINLTNYRFVKNGIIFQVKEHDPMSDKISVMVDNKKILSGR